ncbi:GPR55 protein, partial [Heliornis fulica]|nr:GPR55 protein [Heliornis fulica]
MTNSSRICNFIDIDNVTATLRLFFSIPTFIFGLSSNILALLVFCCFWKKQNRTSVYMLNLAIADVLLLLSLPLKAYYSSTEAPGLLCASIQFVYFINTYVSVFTIVCITVDRYICIKHPFKGRAHQSPKLAVCICIIIWAITSACSSPMYLFYTEEHIKCFYNMSDEAWSSPLIASVEIFGFLIPLTVMVFCSAQNIWILHNRKSQAGKKSESSLRVIINLMVFLMCFTPVHLAIFLQCLVRRHVIVDCHLKQKISFFIQVSMILANFNCCLDAIFYYFAAADFREKINLKRFLELCPIL